MDLHVSWILFATILEIWTCAVDALIVHKPAISGQNVSLYCNRTESSDASPYFWITPGGKVLEASQDSSLLLSNIQPENSGKYVCVRRGSSGLVVQEEIQIPYVVVRKNYVHSFLIGIGLAALFALCAVGLILLSKYRWKPEYGATFEYHRGGGGDSSYGMTPMPGSSQIANGEEMTVTEPQLTYANLALKEDEE